MTGDFCRNNDRKHRRRMTEDILSE